MEQSPGPEMWPVAKICPPNRESRIRRALVSRPRLLAPLNAAAYDGRVVLVVAPGGSGKTSLLADWVLQAELPVAWYALDSADQDLRRLIYGLCAAVGRVLPGAAGPARAALDAGAPEAAAAGLLLGALEDQPLALVLDDFQHLDDRPDAVALWDHILRFRPPTLTLIILTRSVPLLGFAALAAMDELTGLGRVDLRFDAAEAADLLDVHGLDASGAAHLSARSGGWATGVLLLARAAPGGVRFLRARVDALMEHLGAEVLATLPAQLRLFMLESAAIGPATPDDADAILGRRDSAALYADAEARGLFLDQDESLYRYHDLFGEYLTGVLHNDDPERLQPVRCRAAEYWCARDDLPRALSVLAAGEDWSALSAMLDRERGALWARGLWGTALAHIEHLPPEYRTPRLLALCGHAHAQRGEHAQALELADAGMAAATDDEEWLSPALLRVHALMQAQRFEDGVRSADAALAVAQHIDHSTAVTRLRELRGICWLRLGRFDEGISDLLAILATHQSNGDIGGEALTLFHLATQLIDAGHTRDAEEYLNRSGALWQRLNNAAILGDVHNSRALLHMLNGDVVAAYEEAKLATVVAREVGHPVLDCAATSTLAEVCADAGNAQDADRHASAAAEMAARLDMGDALNDAMRARIAAALLRRDRAGARRLIDEARPLVLTPVDGALLDLYDGMLALRSRAFTRANEALGQAAARLDAVHRPHSAARAHLLHAEALLAGGAIRRAETTLNRMAALVLPLGCEDYLRAPARQARRVLTQYRELRRLRRDTRLLLDRLAAAVQPALALLAADDEVAVEPLALRLSPFGHGRISLANREIDGAVLPPKARELLFFTARAGRPVSRDEIVEAIWPDDERAAQALWDASRHLRRLLGEESWGPRGGLYVLQLPLCDASREFERLAAILSTDAPIVERLAAAERALDLAGEGGGYLEWCDSLWAGAERARLGQQITRVALGAAEIYDRLGRTSDAVAACRRAVALDPYDEAPRAALLRYLSAADEVHTALQEYSAYRRLLRKELDVEPSPLLRELAVDLGWRR